MVMSLQIPGDGELAGPFQVVMWAQPRHLATPGLATWRPKFSKMGWREGGELY